MNISSILQVKTKNNQHYMYNNIYLGFDNMIKYDLILIHYLISVYLREVEHVKKYLLILIFMWS